MNWYSEGRIPGTGWSVTWGIPVFFPRFRGASDCVQKFYWWVSKP